MEILLCKLPTSLMSPRSHNPKVVGSNPTPATNEIKGLAEAPASPLVVLGVFGRALAASSAARMVSVGEIVPCNASQRPPTSYKAFRRARPRHGQALENA